MYVDDTDSLHLIQINPHGSFLMEVMKEHIKEGDVVLDIGAHIGYYTVLFNDWVGPDGRVHAFEPNPELWDVLSDNITLNKSSSTTAWRLALGDISGDRIFYINEDKPVDGRLFRGDIEHLKPIFVETSTLDEWVVKHYNNKPVNFIKLDVQGSEGLVLEGMEECLQTPNLKIVLEFAPSHLQYSSVDAEKVLAILIYAGYTLHHIDSFTHVVRPVKARQLLQYYTVERNQHTDILCIHA